jgi:hypothetical protein
MINPSNQEWQQPILPMRITTSSEKYWSCHTVYAVRIEENGLTYMTANGLTYGHRESAFAETLINGEWISMTSTLKKPLD